MIDLARQPEWGAVQLSYGREFQVHLAGTDGNRITWHVEFTSFDNKGQHSRKAWYAWPDRPDPDRWDKPVLLHRRLTDAKDEFLLRVVYGWQRGYGFADGGTGDAIYGRTGLREERRERRFIVAELHERAICARCGKSLVPRADGTLKMHNVPQGLERCRGSHEAPAVEPVIEGW